MNPPENLEQSASEVRPPTYRDIAKSADVSVATVSMAMRNDPRISAPVRERIQVMARTMGYRANPLLAVYQSAVRSRKLHEVQATLGWINDNSHKNVWETDWNHKLYEGARSRARVLGYALDHIWIPGIKSDDAEGNLLRWDKILRNRGIRGVILPLLARPHHAVLPWQGYAVACIGRHDQLLNHSNVSSATRALHHCVNEDAYQNTLMALENLRRLGYKRIGLAITEWVDYSTDYLESAAYLRYSYDWPANQRVPILMSSCNKEIADWARQNKPDAILCSSNTMRPIIESIGWSVPEDVGLAHLNLAEDVAGWSGIDRRQNLLGSAVVDLVVSHLQRNEYGPPLFAKRMAIEGVWIEGNTTRAH